MQESLPLRDVIALQPHWWPPAPIWWLLALMTVLALVWVSRWLIGYLRSPYAGLKKAALIELDHIETLNAENAPQLAKEISSLLKRVAMSRFPEQQTACLSGERWIAFLNQSVGEAHFSDADSMVLKSAQYQRAGRFNQMKLVSAARQWINAL